MPINNIGEAFILAGIPTIPMLCTSITRGENKQKLYGFTAPSGDTYFKETPQGALPKGWNSQETKHTNYNRKATPCMVAIMGHARAGTTNIVAIDCDNQATFDYFRTLDPTHPYYFTSKGKGGGTIIYRYDIRNKALNKSTRASQSATIETESGEHIKVELDYLSTNRLMFLPTSGNETKNVPQWDINKTAKVTCMPIRVQSALAKVLDRSLTGHKTPDNSTTTPTEKISAPKDIESNKKKVSNILRMDALTHKYTGEHYIDYDDLLFARTAIDFTEGTIGADDFCNFLFPDKKGTRKINSFSEIPDGDRHEIIIKNINYRLIWCRGINNTLRKKILNKICEYTTWSKAEAQSEINNTIINEGAVCDDHIHYAKNIDVTKQFPLMCVSPSGRYIEIYRDIRFDAFLAVDYGQNKIRLLSNEQQLMGEIKHNTTLKEKAKKIVDSTLAIGEFYSTETKVRSLGRSCGHDTINLYASNHCETIANYPQKYADLYAEQIPHYTLNIMKALFTDPLLLQYLLAFFRDLLIRDESSPVIPLNEGVYGSCKTGFWEGVIGEGIFKDKMGKFNISEIGKMRFNPDWAGKRILISNEGLLYATKAFKNEMAKKLHDFSGSHFITIEEKFKTKITVRNFITFVLNANLGESVYEFEHLNRRDLPIFYPKVEFRNSDLVTTAIKDMGEERFKSEHNNDKDSVATMLINKAKEEAPLFAYWLATEVAISYPDGSGFLHAYKSLDSINRQGEREDITTLISKWFVNPTKYMPHIARHFAEAISDKDFKLDKDNNLEMYQYGEYLSVETLFDYSEHNTINPNALLALIEMRGTKYEKQSLCSINGLSRFLRKIGVNIVPHRFRIVSSTERISRWRFVDANGNQYNTVKIKESLQHAVDNYGVESETENNIISESNTQQHYTTPPQAKQHNIAPQIQNRPPPDEKENLIW